MAEKKDPIAPITVEDDSELTPELDSLVDTEIKELVALGVVVKRVVFRSLDEPPKYFITFDPDFQLYKTRMALESEGWDVGQSMGVGGKSLSFYATKRVTESKGWEV